MRIDLHVHTNESDGTWTPREVVHEAFARGLSVIAITDHDTTEGIAAAIEHAPKGLEVIPGIELGSIAPDGEDLHILGLWIDPTYGPLQEQLALFRASRRTRIDKILVRLQNLGITITKDEVVKYAHKGVLSRSHIASALLAKGIVSSKDEAFARFIGQGAPAYVERHKLTPERAVELISEAGGVPILAHPGLNKDLGVLPALIKAGLKGLEVIHPRHSQEQTEYYLELAKRSGLLPSGGSDCHGPGGKDHIYLGEYTIPERWLHDLAQTRGS